MPEITIDLENIPLTVTTIERGNNPLIVIMPDDFTDLMRAIADKTGYGDRAVLAGQAAHMNGDQADPMLLVNHPIRFTIMVSNIPNSRGR